MKKSGNGQSEAKGAFDSFSGEYAAKIDSFLESFFQRKRESAALPFIAENYSDLQEYCLRPGKRIRPLLLLLSYIGYRGRKRHLAEMVKIASTLELMHSFLLVQDDIIDRAELRRGGKALHLVSGDRYRKWTRNRMIGSDIALVLADVLFSNALEIISTAKISPQLKNAYIGLFAQTYEFTAWGQILDSLHSLPRNLRHSGDIPLQISTLKTAYYTICNPLLMGLVLTGRYSDSEALRIRNFAIPLGLAFQIRDDILGVFGSADEIGKSSDSDIVEGKSTLLIQNTVDRMKRGEVQRFVNTFSRVKKTKADIAFIRKSIQKSGAYEKTSKTMSELLAAARKEVQNLALRERYRGMLVELIDKLSRM
jgi:geranylgeranyl diphosphate synthase type I